MGHETALTKHSIRSLSRQIKSEAVRQFISHTILKRLTNKKKLTTLINNAH
jgi:hypothetical protein